MSGLLKLILSVLASFFRLRARLEAENLVLRQQINVLRRRTPKRPHLNNTDRSCLFGSIAGFPQFLKRWRLSGRRQLFGGTALGFGRTGVGGHAIVLADLSADLRKLIGEMSHANPLWGAPHIHGELLKLGFEVAQSTVARYMCRRSGSPSQGWRTFQVELGALAVLQEILACDAVALGEPHQAAFVSDEALVESSSLLRLDDRCSIAQIAACVRLPARILRKIALTCTFTVVSAISKWRAMSLFEWPCIRH
jgi:hypothetical protein